MKVLHILNELRYSGMEMMLVNSFENWKEFGVELEIIATGKDKGESYALLSEKGYSLLHIPFHQNKFKSFLNLRKVLKEKNYDLVHIHTEGNFLIHVLNAYLSGHKSIVRTFHSIFKPRFLGKLRRFFDRFIAYLIGVKYISVGDSVAHNEKINFFTKSKIIYNWYDNTKFKPIDSEKKERIRNDLKLDNDVFVITSVGNCSIIKRHELIIESLSKLPKSMNWVYLHVGRENIDCDERALAKKLGIYEKCHFIGLITNANEILSVSDVYVMSSKVEGLSIAAIESIATGIPTLLSKVPGLNDILKLVPESVGYDGNPEDLANVIQEIHNLSIEERIDLTKKLAQTALDLFSTSKGVREYFEYYSKLIH